MAGKAGQYAVPVTLDASVSPRVREATRLIPSIDGQPPTARSHAALSACLYGNPSGAPDVSAPWGAATQESVR
jgi:hypothetical protein